MSELHSKKEMGLCGGGPKSFMERLGVKKYKLRLYRTLHLPMAILTTVYSFYVLRVIDFENSNFFLKIGIDLKFETF